MRFEFDEKINKEEEEKKNSQIILSEENKYSEYPRGKIQEELSNQYSIVLSQIRKVEGYKMERKRSGKESSENNKPASKKKIKKYNSPPKNKHHKYSQSAAVVSLDTRASEQYSLIRSNMKFKLEEYDMKTIAITSSILGEGKTTTSINLARAFARDGFKVLLIDADLRRPNIGRSLRLSEVNGLSTLLTKRLKNVGEFLVTVPSIENLWVLPSGLVPNNPAELLGSKRMTSLIKELRQHFDLLIFDLPPIGVVTDAQVVSALTDATVLVVRDEYAKKQEVLEAKELLEKANANLIGAVLNGVKQSEDSYNNSYY